MEQVDHKLCEVAVDSCDTAAFETFAQAFHAAIVGSNFVALGGMHDGGADGFEEPISESAARPGTFLQASKTSDIEGKIRKTVRRMREFGRDPKVITFYFSQPISTVDQIEEKLSNETDVTIRVRAKQFIVSQINQNPGTIQAYRSYLEASVGFLSRIGAAGQKHQFPFEAKTLCSFLGQEINRRRGDVNLLTSVTDSLIFWSLEGTDPEAKIFMTRPEILAKIESALPAAKLFIRGNMDDRLKKLASKNNPSGREINHYKNGDKFALRYEQRRLLIEENVAEAALYTSITDGFRIGARATLPVSLHNRIEDVVQAVHLCIEKMYERQGVAVSLYIIDQNDDALKSLSVADVIEAKVDEFSLTAADARCVRECVSGILGKAIYNPTPEQHEYMLRLSSTYFLMFALKNEPRVVEYFNGMAQELILYVGSDLIIKAISEHYLPSAGRLVASSLEVMRRSGAKLIMAEPAFDEVFTHLRAADLEFVNYYAPIEPAIDRDFVHLIDRILIRAYFYAKFGVNVEGKVPNGWRSYVGQFCNYEGLRSGSSRDGLRIYLCDRFGFSFERTEDMRRTVDRDELKKLTNAIVEQRQWARKTRATLLAYNDALHALAVYRRRLAGGEDISPNPFGYKTWWLTHEKVVQRAAALALGPGRARFIMRPEFLLKYIAFAPSKREISESYRAVFPTILGVSLSKRVDNTVLRAGLLAAREAYSVDDSRARAMIKEFADALKSDQLRLYETNLVTPAIDD